MTLSVLKCLIAVLAASGKHQRRNQLVTLSDQEGYFCLRHRVEGLQ